jgi:hypothetical protein
LYRQPLRATAHNKREAGWQDTAQEGQGSGKAVALFSVDSYSKTPKEELGGRGELELLNVFPERTSSAATISRAKTIKIIEERKTAKRR